MVKVNPRVVNRTIRLFAISSRQHCCLSAQLVPTTPPKSHFTSSAIATPLFIMSRIKSAFRKWLLLTINSDANGMATAFQDLCKILCEEQPSTKDSTMAELQAGLAAWVKQAQHGVSETDITILTIMTMPLPALNISASLASLFWAMEATDYEQMNGVFIQLRARVLFDLPTYDTTAMKHIVSAAFRLWSLGERYGKRMASARRQFYVEIEMGKSNNLESTLCDQIKC